MGLAITFDTPQQAQNAVSSYHATRRLCESPQDTTVCAGNTVHVGDDTCTWWWKLAEGVVGIENRPSNSAKFLGANEDTRFVMSSNGGVSISGTVRGPISVTGGGGSGYNVTIG